MVRRISTRRWITKINISNRSYFPTLDIAQEREEGKLKRELSQQDEGYLARRATMRRKTTRWINQSGQNLAESIPSEDLPSTSSGLTST